MFQKLGPTGSVKSPLRAQRAVVVDLDQQLRQGAGSRAVDRLRSVEHVEGRLVARTPELVILGQVETQRTPGVRAHLRVADQTLGGTGRAIGGQLQHVRRHLDQDRL